MIPQRHIFKQLNQLKGSKTIIVGIGNTLRADDGAGSLVCERLANANISAEVIDAATVPENYIQKIIKKSPENLLIIDAIDFAAEPGMVKLFKSCQLNSMVISTHMLSPRIFVDMIQKSIKVNVYIIGIQPARIETGGPVSEQITQAVTKVSEILCKIFSPEQK